VLVQLLGGRRRRGATAACYELLPIAPGRQLAAAAAAGCVLLLPCNDEGHRDFAQAAPGVSTFGIADEKLAGNTAVEGDGLSGTERPPEAGESVGRGTERYRA